MRYLAILLLAVSAFGQTTVVNGWGGGGATNPTANGVQTWNTSTWNAATYTNLVSLFGSGSCSGYLKSDGTCSTPSVGVASVGLSLPTTLCAVTGSPVTTTGTLTCSYATGQTANMILGSNNLGNVGLMNLTTAQLPVIASTFLSDSSVLIRTTDTGSVTNTMLAGAIANSKLSNASTTVNGTTCTLGSTCTITTGATTNQNIRTIGAIFGSFQSGATALSSGATACVPTYFGGTIQSVEIIGNVSGSATIDVQTVAHTSWTGTSSISSIAASAVPALSTASRYTDSTLTGWTTTLPAGTDVCFVMTSPTTVAGLSISLKVAAN